jgi:protein-tyrosine phosphatase
LQEEGFSISALQAGRGLIGISPAPGRSGSNRPDLQLIIDWAPVLVVRMTEMDELDRIGAPGLADDLALAGIGWRHLPIKDFGSPSGATLAAWPDASRRLRADLSEGQRVLVHCMGGCGRSGMIALRLLCELGEVSEAGLRRLRAVRQCAVETEDQLRWAFDGAS